MERIHERHEAERDARGSRRRAVNRPASVAMDRAQIERRMLELALEHVAARISDAADLSRMARLREGVGRDATSP